MLYQCTHICKGSLTLVLHPHTARDITDVSSEALFRQVKFFNGLHVHTQTIGLSDIYGYGLMDALQATVNFKHNDCIFGTYLIEFLKQVNLSNKIFAA